MKQEQEQGRADKFRTIMFTRIGSSIFLFVAFLVLSVSYAFASQRGDLIVLGTLIFAILVLPRQTHPSGVELDEFERERALRYRNWLAIVRAVYFGIALVTLFLLPSLL